MHLEFCNYNKPYFDDLDEQRREIFDAIQAGFSGVCLPLYLLRDIREYISGIDMSFACPVDFPNGTGDKKLREHETLSCLKSQANTIDLVLNPFLIKERKYDKIVKEISTHKRMCNDYDATLRIIIHHNLYIMREAIAIARLVEDTGCRYIIPSSGYHNDDIYDNLMIANAIEQKTRVKVISNGYIWLKKQYVTAINSKIFGLRLYSLNLLSSFSV